VIGSEEHFTTPTHSLILVLPSMPGLRRASCDFGSGPHRLGLNIVRHLVYRLGSARLCCFAFTVYITYGILTLSLNGLSLPEPNPELECITLLLLFV
jgi:hypothetical protein